MNLVFVLSILLPAVWCFVFFFFNDTATTEIYTLSLHDALPIALERLLDLVGAQAVVIGHANGLGARAVEEDRKSTRLNSSHANISYAVFCLKKKKKTKYIFLLIKKKKK